MKLGEQQVKGIIFDLDGTLYSLKGFNSQIAWRSLRYLRLLLWMLRVRYSLRGVDLETSEKFYASFFQKLAELARKNLNALEDWYFNSFYPIFIRLLKEKFRLRPQLKEFLEKLKTCGIKTAILSDYSFVRERLEALQLAPEYFDVLASNEEYGVLKPSKRPLLSIADLLGTSPAETLVIGDRESTDGQGAALAGIPFLNITDPSAFNEFYQKIMKI